MASAKIAITIDRELLATLDQMVKEQRFPNRSSVFQAALREKLDRVKQTRLARECAKLDPKYERDIAEEGMAKDMEQWPEY